MQHDGFLAGFMIAPAVADYEQGEIGHDLFLAACTMGLEGIVSKHRGRAYRGGKCNH
ncbi:MAG TPA: hypothetical protein VGJ20_27135 [Xanthobacteraceae bacterium]